MKNQAYKNIKRYHFEFKHLTVLFVGLIIFQLILSYVHKTTLRNFVDNTQEWFQKNSAEKIANLSATTLELLLENSKLNLPTNETDKRKLIQFFDIILNQQILQQNVEEICLLLNDGKTVRAIDGGKDLFSFISSGTFSENNASSRHAVAITLYDSIKSELQQNEQIINILKDKQTYHIFVPFVPNGEFVGALYMRNTADVTFIQREIVSSYEETSIIYSALFLLGLLAMYYVSTFTVKERDEAQKLLLDEHEVNIKKQMDHEKEALFTKRIYHTHHKAEKVMGFIKDDLRNITVDNMSEIKNRVSRYSNFISRVIYDMKWYDPPIQTIRNSAFKTDLNDVIKFLVDNIFNRTSKKSGSFEIQYFLDKKIPIININEFVVWEVIEPLVQNSIDHCGDVNLLIKIETAFVSERKATILRITDNGIGIQKDLLIADEKGVKRLFLENVTTKENEKSSSGYGCYIAYQIARQRCGWYIDAENLPEGGCRFTITIPN